MGRCCVQNFPSYRSRQTGWLISKRTCARYILVSANSEVCKHRIVNSGHKEVDKGTSEKKEFKKVIRTSGTDLDFFQADANVLLCCDC